MAFRLRQVIVLVVLSTLPASCFAQWIANPGSNLINPNSGLTPNPVFIYDSSDGIFSVVNAGDNGLVDTPGATELLGDDFGLVSLLVSFTGETNTLNSMLPSLTGTVAWSTPVIFNDKIQFSGSTIGSAFLAISDQPTPLFQIDPGLTAEDFVGPGGLITIETGMNFGLNQPGRTFFSDGDPLATGAFRIVPEPYAASLLLVGLIGLVSRGSLRRSYAPTPLAN